MHLTFCYLPTCVCVCENNWADIEMSPKCKVATLGQLALCNVVTQVTHALSDDEGIYYNQVNEYHKFTPPEILQDMLSQILHNENLDAGTRFSCLQVFLSSNVRKLETGIFPQCYYNQILKVIATNGSGLIHLNLKGVWIKDSKLVSNVLKEMHQLKVLHIPYIVDDLILESIAPLSNLRLLNIAGECNFTEEAISRFCAQSKLNRMTLKVLDIGSFGDENIRHEAIAEIIETMPELVTLNSYSFVGKSLFYVYQKNPTFKCQLKYVHDTNTTAQICETISKTCPILEDIYLDTPKTDALLLLQQFRTLNSLKITKFDCNNLTELFTNWGVNLRTIKLSFGSGSLDLSILAIKCPQLTSLDLYKLETIHNTNDAPFERLQSVEITYSNLRAPGLIYLLKQSELRRLVIGGAIQLTDGDLYRICAECSLIKLEVLLFTSARYLTTNTIELLMGHCPRLRVIGLFSGWNITINDVEFLQALIQITNTDLTLLSSEVSLLYYE